MIAIFFISLYEINLKFKNNECSMFCYTLKYYIYMLMYIGRYLVYKKDYVILLMKHHSSIEHSLLEAL